MTNTDQLRELIADVIRNKSHYGVAETPVLNGLMPLVEQYTANAVRAALETERTVTLGLSNDGKMKRALYLAEEAGYKKAIQEAQNHKQRLDALKKEGSDE